MEENISQPEQEARERPVSGKDKDDSILGVVFLTGGVLFILVLVLLFMNDLVGLMFSFSGLFAWILFLWFLGGFKLLFFLLNHYVLNINFPSFIAKKIGMPIWWIIFIMFTIFVGINIFTKIIPYDEETVDLSPAEIAQGGGPYMQMEILNLPEVVEDACTLYDLEIRASNIGDETLKYEDIVSRKYNFDLAIPNLFLTNTSSEDWPLSVEDFGEIKPGQTKTVMFKTQVASTGFEGEPTNLYNPFASWQQSIDPINLQVRAMFSEVDTSGNATDILRSDDEFQTLTVDSWVVYDDPDFGTTFDGNRNCEPEVLN